ncbi:MAG: tetratricopeptide repeat protein [Spirochaetaceae bacterium]|jgi:tetratricopeptide (TPR) repeat protein|nr:tetratricopeptide repeat protein [Spirochaetaceae bacterium]
MSAMIFPETSPKTWVLPLFRRFWALVFIVVCLFPVPGDGTGERNAALFSFPGRGVVPVQAALSSGTERVLSEIADLLAGGDYTGAIAKFDEIHGPLAASVEIRLLKASVYFSAGMMREARALVRELLAAEPNNPDILYVLASIEDAEGKTREYRSTLERIINIAPAHLDTLISLGNLQLNNNSWRVAATWFDRALAVDAGNGDALIGRAEAYRRTNAPERAMELLDRAIQLYPQWALPRSERARLHRTAGDYEAALADLVRARELSPMDYWVACDMGNVLLSLERKREALAEFSRAARLDPNNFLAYVYLAGLKDDLGDLDGAAEAYQTLARLNPGYFYAFEGVGIHRMRTKQWAEARDAFREAWNHNQDEWGYALLAAACWMRAERLQAPKQFLETALRRFSRDSIEWNMLRLYSDLSGDTGMAVRIEQERNTVTKARMIFYLALYHDVRGNSNLANQYFLHVKQLDQKAIPEWRLNEWICGERNLTL